MTIDSNVEIVGDLDEFVDVTTLIMIFLCHRIPIVKTIYPEVEKIRRIHESSGKWIKTDENMEESIDFMSLKGHKFDNGYHESTMSVRTNNKGKVI